MTETLGLGPTLAGRLPTAGDEATPADPLLSEAVATDLADLFRALADPTRARIVYALSQLEMTTSQLAELLEVGPPTVSQHLRLLRALRLVKTHRDGREVFYNLDDAHIRLLVSLSLTHLRERPGNIN
ncbi:MAG TPA: metalloregulator ArsR/SmtB family transcription factor [Chloroflexota bacterium]|jgi:DNA-binding transcriptional ArsR family regulator